MAECQGSQNLPSRQSFVAFASNSHTIAELERNQLSKWASEMNSKYPIQNWITVIGGASRNEIEPYQLATKRASAVAKTIIDDGLINAPIQINMQINPTNSTTESSAETREVTVQVSPGCPNNCCDGM
ncbi:hypothetical protein CUJ89_17555 [Burkholderia pyrrocinia]|uniref:OmpA-like domain-containing protein n=2 Tax=Burkholderia pyrrocinia TaxID=60550 RepID=A0A2Z5MXZ0_BURPY|nr:hypothetical protein CUJ89_17555 [Burkholderia pyrrocinia]